MRGLRLRLVFNFVLPFLRTKHSYEIAWPKLGIWSNGAMSLVNILCPFRVFRFVLISNSEWEALLGILANLRELNFVNLLHSLL